MRSLIRRLYWKVIAVFARITRSVNALNEGFSPQGSVSTGPHQPLSALRDAVSLLGATAGRLDARLERMSLAPTGPIDRLSHAVALAELSRAPQGTTMTFVGDAVALRLACDLADLNYDVLVWDTVETGNLALPETITRVALADAEPLSSAVLVVASSMPLSSLPKHALDAIDSNLHSSPKALLVSVAPFETEAASGGDIPWRSTSKTLRIDVRRMTPVEFTTSSRPLRSIVLATQLG